jgi:hypothetical protein
MPVIPALRRLRQEDHELESSSFIHLFTYEYSKQTEHYSKHK